MEKEDPVEESTSFTSTMRIDITPDILKEMGAPSPKSDTRRIRRKTPVIKVPHNRKRGSEGSRYKQLLDSIYDGVLITDMAGNVVEVNPRAVEFLRYDPAKLIGLSVLDIIAGSDQELLDAIRENLESERYALIQAYCIRHDHTYFPAEIAVNIFRLSEPRMCFFIRDITIRKQTEDQLRTEHNAIQNAVTGIAIVDTSSRLQYVNPAMLELWGFKQAEDILGHNVASLLKDHENAARMVQRVIEQQEPWDEEMVALRADGSEFEVQVSGACNRDADGEVLGVVFSFLDITDRKRAEEAMRQAAEHRAMLASVGAACHHLGQPATVIVTNLEMMKRRESGLPEEVRSLVDGSLDAAELLGQILHKLNAVTEYRTTEYIPRKEDSDKPTNRILEIG